MPIDRSTDTHRVVDIDPHNPVHQAIVSNPGGSNVMIKNGRLNFTLPKARHEEAPAKPAPKTAEKPTPKPAPAKPAPAKPVEKPADKPVKKPKKSAEPKRTGMAALADKNKARELEDARRNAALKAKKLGKQLWQYFGLLLGAQNGI